MGEKETVLRVIEVTPGKSTTCQAHTFRGHQALWGGWRTPQGKWGKGWPMGGLDSTSCRQVTSPQGEASAFVLPQVSSDSATLRPVLPKHCHLWLCVEASSSPSPPFSPFCLLFHFWGRVSVCSSGWPGAFLCRPNWPCVSVIFLYLTHARTVGALSHSGYRIFLSLALAAFE